MNRSAFAPGLALLVALLPGLPAARADETAKKLAELAKKVYDELEQLKTKEIYVERFTDGGHVAGQSGTGPMIQARLTEECKKLGLRISPDANYKLTGKFFPDKKMAEDGHLGLKLVCDLCEKDGEPHKQYTTILGYKSNEDLVKLFAMSVDLTEKYNDTPQEVNKYLKEKKAKPEVYAKAEEVKVRKDSPYAVKILAADAHSKDEAFKHRPFTVQGGHTRVSLHKGEEYRIRLCNTSEYEIAVAITIDGLDAFEFFEPSKGKPAYYLVAPGKERVVKGWKVNTEKDEAFLVGSLEHSAAAKLYKLSDAVGTITVCIHPAWEKDHPPPAYKDLPRSIGTERGRHLFNPSKVSEREIGPLIEAISIRYKKD
jgi:hypothetical protein